MANLGDAQQMPFIKNLASSDRKLRTSSLQSLQSFLSFRTSLTPLDARKLWTGLYYAHWMTDRPRPQQALAAELAGLAFALRDGCAAAWFEGFWAVLGAQWAGIEALRLDKFMLLVRRVFAAQVRWARERGFTGGAEVDAVAAVLAGWCFDAADANRVALGLRLHVLDIWVDELEREGLLGAGAEADEGTAAFVRKLGDLVEGLKRCPVKAVRQRAAESLEDGRLPWASLDEGGEQGDEEEEEDGEWGGIED